MRPALGENRVSERSGPHDRVGVPAGARADGRYGYMRSVCLPVADERFAAMAIVSTSAWWTSPSADVPIASDGSWLGDHLALHTHHMAGFGPFEPAPCIGEAQDLAPARVAHRQRVAPNACGRISAEAEAWVADGRSGRHARIFVKTSTRTRRRVVVG